MGTWRWRVGAPSGITCSTTMTSMCAVLPQPACAVGGGEGLTMVADCVIFYNRRTCPPPRGRALVPRALLHEFPGGRQEQAPGVCSKCCMGKPPSASPTWNMLIEHHVLQRVSS